MLNLKFQYFGIHGYNIQLGASLINWKSKTFIECKTFIWLSIVFYVLDVGDHR